MPHDQCNWHDDFRLLQWDISQSGHIDSGWSETKKKKKKDRYQTFLACQQEELVIQRSLLLHLPHILQGQKFIRRGSVRALVQSCHDDGQGVGTDTDVHPTGNTCTLRSLKRDDEESFIHRSVAAESSESVLLLWSYGRICSASAPRCQLDSLPPPGMTLLPEVMGSV